MTWQKLYLGDVMDALKMMPSESVDCCVTSPPYWGLRDYGCEGQIGLEKTPEEYVAKMVEVFREVRRVLKKEGTLFLNLGDSYAGSMSTNKAIVNMESLSGKAGGQTEGYRKEPRGNVNGLKPKDLVGIPWRVAFALQQPFFTGRIKDEHDRIWLAAMIEAEGCMFIHKRKEGQNNGQGYERKHDSYGAGMEVANTSETIVKRCQEITGVGSICFQDKESRMKNRNQRLFRWNVRSNECRWIVQELYPHFVAKKHQARLLLGCPSSGEEAEKAHLSLIALHNGKEATIDFPAPASMFEPGFYLRSDVIWSKNNPMPESVTDRCTKSHEYVFLLAKSAKYFYDAEAVKENADAEPDRRLRSSTFHKVQQIGHAMSSADYVETVGRNRRSVWTITTKPFSGAHFATFPPDLIEPMIKAGTSEKGVCPKCGKAWERITETKLITFSETYSSPKQPKEGAFGQQAANRIRDGHIPGYNDTKTLGWRASCSCGIPPVPAVVLDPFMGSGTTFLVSRELGRNSIGIELNPKYADIMKKRLGWNNQLQKTYEIIEAKP